MAEDAGSAAAPLRRVLAALGADGQGPVLARAAAVARLRGAELRLGSMVCDPYAAGERFSGSADLDAAREALVAARREALEAEAGALRAGGLAVSVAAAWCYPEFEGYVGAARDFDADLMVAAPRPSGRRRTGLGSADWELIRHSPCPVLLARGDAAPYADVLVAVDPMHAHDRPASLDDRLIGLARALCAPGGRVRLLHCHLPAEYVPFRAPGARPSALFHGRESSLASHQEALLELARRHGIAVADARLEAGDAREAIPDLAARGGAGLVVMGAVARSRLQRLLVGSTADAVIGRLACDVLAVKPAGA